MNVLMVGTGGGSWQVRGQQLGAAMGARVTVSPSDADIAWADVVVLVKRAARTWAPVIRRAGKPIVWDALDFWQQPDQNRLETAAASVLLSDTISLVRPALVIGATEAMARPANGVYVPHHSWSGLVPTPARAQVQTVAYEGSARYLGKWRAPLERACARRGWAFIVNPPHLSMVDILVSFRGGEWDGWMCREWKSGVKAVNALAAGRPLIHQPSAATREMAVPGAVVERLEDIGVAFDAWTSMEARQSVVAEAIARAPRYRVDNIAAEYLGVLRQVVTRSEVPVAC